MNAKAFCADRARKRGLLGCIECMRCRLLLPTIAVSVRQSVCHAAQLGFTVLKRLNGSRFSLWWILMWPKEHCQTGVLISPQRGGGELGENSANCGPTNEWVSEWVSEQFLNGTSAHRRPLQCHYMVDPLPISRYVEARDLLETWNFVCWQRTGAPTKTMQK